MAGERKKAAQAASSEPEQLEGDALEQRARELNIEGRSKLSADELRNAVAEAEAAAENDAQQERVAEHEADSAAAPSPAEQGAQLPPAPPAPTGAGTDPQTSPSQDAIPKDALIARATALLGVTPATARGVLAEADDPITIDAASARIQEFLGGAVANTEEA